MHASNTEWYRSVTVIDLAKGKTPAFRKNGRNAVIFGALRFTVTNVSPGHNTVNPVFPVGADGISNDARTFRNIPPGGAIIGR